MFDDAFDDADDDLFGMDDPFELYEDLPAETGFLGLTAGQRFILSILLFATVVVMGVTVLVVMGRIVIPLP